MRIIHGQGYSDEDKRGYITLVYQNVITAMHSLTRAMETLKIPYKDTSNPVSPEFISELNCTPPLMNLEQSSVSVLLAVERAES
jgi:hypothetical protein